MCLSGALKSSGLVAAAGTLQPAEARGQSDTGPPDLAGRQRPALQGACFASAGDVCAVRGNYRSSIKRSIGELGLPALLGFEGVTQACAAWRLDGRILPDGVPNLMGCLIKEAPLVIFVDCIYGKIYDIAGQTSIRDLLLAQG